MHFLVGSCMQANNYPKMPFYYYFPGLLASVKNISHDFPTLRELTVCFSTPPSLPELPLWFQVILVEVKLRRVAYNHTLNSTCTTISLPSRRLDSAYNCSITSWNGVGPGSTPYQTVIFPGGMQPVRKIIIIDS